MHIIMPSLGGMRGALF